MHEVYAKTNSKPPVDSRFNYVRAKRKCLGGCGRQFVSEWNGERICSACKGKEGRSGGLDEEFGVAV